jgi:hypothetical protein
MSIFLREKFNRKHETRNVNVIVENNGINFDT